MINIIASGDENVALVSSDSESGQTPAESSAGLGEVKDQYVTDAEKNQDMIQDLKAALDGDGDNLSNEAKLMNSFIEGKEYYNAVKDDPRAIEQKMEELSSYYGTKIDIAKSVRTKFGDLPWKSEEEVVEIYLKDFEPQTSEYYFGKFLLGAEHEAFKVGFFSAKNGTPTQWRDSDFWLTVAIMDKLTAAQKYVNGSEYYIKKYWWKPKTVEGLRKSFGFLDDVTLKGMTVPGGTATVRGAYALYIDELINSKERDGSAERGSVYDTPGTVTSLIKNWEWRVIEKRANERKFNSIQSMDSLTAISWETYYQLLEENKEYKEYKKR